MARTALTYVSSAMMTHNHLRASSLLGKKALYISIV